MVTGGGGVSNEELNAKIYTMLTELSVKVADISARLASLNEIFVKRKDCEHYREKCCSKLTEVDNKQSDRWFKVAMELIKILGAAVAGGAIGSKIIGG